MGNSKSRSGPKKGNNGIKRLAQNEKKHVDHEILYFRGTGIKREDLLEFDGVAYACALSQGYPKDKEYSPKGLSDRRKSRKREGKKLTKFDRDLESPESPSTEVLQELNEQGQTHSRKTTRNKQARAKPDPASTTREDGRILDFDGTDWRVKGKHPDDMVVYDQFQGKTYKYAKDNGYEGPTPSELDRERRFRQEVEVPATCTAADEQLSQMLANIKSKGQAVEDAICEKYNLFPEGKFTFNTSDDFSCKHNKEGKPDGEVTGTLNRDAFQKFMNDAGQKRLDIDEELSMLPRYNQRRLKELPQTSVLPKSYATCVFAVGTLVSFFALKRFLKQQPKRELEFDPESQTWY